MSEVEVGVPIARGESPGRTDRGGTRYCFMEIEVKIRALMMDPNSGTPIIILKDVDSDTMLPIWVGAYEANAIALEIEKIAPPRPMTHDLLRNLIIELGIQVERVVVTSLRDNTFFAVIEMRMSDGARMVLDSRPSDEEGGEEATLGEEEWPDVIGEAGDLPM